MIEDLDGGDHGPSRAGLVRGVSVALAVAALLGWAALSSPALRGPYATPDPLTALAAPTRYTPAPTDTIDNAAKFFPVRCIVSGEVFVTTVFVNGQPVVVNGPPMIAPNGQPANLNAPLTRSVATSCLASNPPAPLDRFAR